MKPQLLFLALLALVGINAFITVARRAQGRARDASMETDTQNLEMSAGSMGFIDACNVCRALIQIGIAVSSLVTVLLTSDAIVQLLLAVYPVAQPADGAFHALVVATVLFVVTFLHLELGEGVFGSGDDLRPEEQEDGSPLDICRPLRKDPGTTLDQWVDSNR